MRTDLHLDPDAVDGLARLARRIADDLDAGAPADGDVAESRAAAELAAFADAARAAARRVREADDASAARFR